LIGAAKRPPVAWTLLRHEWRLAWRSVGASRRPGAKSRPRWRSIAAIAILLVLAHTLGLATIALPAQWRDTQPFRIVALGALAFLFTFMLSFAMSRVVSAFHERRDLDLMLAAPIAPVTILFVRAFATVATVWAMFALFVYPFANIAVLSGHWWMARWYPLLPFAALATTGIALLLTDAVVRLVGIRRARVGLQVLSALIGASIYLISQGQNLLPEATRRRWSSFVMDWVARDPWPVRFAAGIADGDVVVWGALVLVSVSLFGLALVVARRRFAAVALMPEADSRVVRASSTAVERRVARGFGRGLIATLLIKEWRLILRAPQLLSQILLQLLYLVPLVFFAFGRNTHGAAPIEWAGAAHASAVVGFASTLATSLAWLSVAAEDAPDLIAGSPRPRGRILAAKLLAATIPPYALVVVGALESLRRSTTEAPVLLIYGALACASAALLSAAGPTNAKRTDFQRRHRGRGFAAVIEGFEFLLWAAAAGLMASGHWIIGLGVTVLALAWPALRLRVALENVRSA